ncbi:hypothetical protein KAR91_64050 [Candidatus Pacearchaeota archaeon]|nr:hypothetical protein [Candidatus Pacearchaeota archaeon]
MKARDEYLKDAFEVQSCMPLQPGQETVILRAMQDFAESYHQEKKKEELPLYDLKEFENHINDKLNDETANIVYKYHQFIRESLQNQEKQK